MVLLKEKEYMFLKLILVIMLIMITNHCFAEHSVDDNNSKTRGKILILGYHKIDKEPYKRTYDQARNHMVVTASRFREQMVYLKENGYESITFHDLQAAREGKGMLPEKPVIITFDDGYSCVYEWAFPVLKWLDMKGVLYVIPDVVGVKRYSNDHFTWEHIRQMLESGFECGSHSMSHPDLTELSDDDLKYEIEESFSIINDETGVEPVSISYPRSQHNSRVRKTALKAGYKAGVTTTGGLNTLRTNTMTLRRVFPLYNDSMKTFKRMIGIDQ